MNRRVRGAAPYVLAALFVLAAVFVRLVLESAFYFFSVLCLAAAAMLALYGLSHRLGERPGKWLRRGLTLVLAAGLICFAVLEGFVIAGSGTDIREEPDVVVILGAHVRPEGPSPNLRDRLETALPYLLEHPELPVVVTGGQGSNEHMSEAQCMHDYLIAHGVAEERIWMEDQARNTVQNLRNTAERLRQEGMEDCHLLVVSSSFHLCRVRMLARRQGLDISTLSARPSHMGYALGNYIRETVGLAKSYFLDR